MEFSRQEYWSKKPVPSPGDLPDLGIEPGFPTLQAYSLPSEPLGKPMNPRNTIKYLAARSVSGHCLGSLGSEQGYSLIELLIVM